MPQPGLRSGPHSRVSSPPRSSRRGRNPGHDLVDVGVRTAARVQVRLRVPVSDIGVDVISELALVLLRGMLVDQLRPLGGLTGPDHEVLELGTGVGRERVARVP